MDLPCNTRPDSGTIPPREVVPSIPLLLALTFAALAIGLAHHLAGHEGWSTACFGLAAVAGAWARLRILVRHRV